MVKSPHDLVNKTHTIKDLSQVSRFAPPDQADSAAASPRGSVRLLRRFYILVTFFGKLRFTLSVVYHKQLSKQNQNVNKAKMSSDEEELLLLYAAKLKKQKKEPRKNN